ncbi:hypothetical protein FRC12_001528 [Ceratobasidium sp. 428]|nr:hypothetical protein FRC12_001528 [Ceratobasidium sp. 428]
MMCLLRGLKAVPPSTNLHDFNPNNETLTSEEAEAIVADNNMEADEADNSFWADSAVDLLSAVEKIRKIAKIVQSSPQRMELFCATAE